MKHFKKVMVTLLALVVVLSMLSFLIPAFTTTTATVAPPAQAPFQGTITNIVTTPVSSTSTSAQ